MGRRRSGGGGRGMGAVRRVEEGQRGGTRVEGWEG